MRRSGKSWSGSRAPRRTEPAAAAHAACATRRAAFFLPGRRARSAVLWERACPRWGVSSQPTLDRGQARSHTHLWRPPRALARPPAPGRRDRPMLQGGDLSNFSDGKNWLKRPSIGRQKLLIQDCHPALNRYRLIQPNSRSKQPEIRHSGESRNPGGVCQNTRLAAFAGMTVVHVLKWKRIQPLTTPPRPPRPPRSPAGRRRRRPAPRSARRRTAPAPACRRAASTRSASSATSARTRPP